LGTLFTFTKKYFFIFVRLQLNFASNNRESYASWRKSLKKNWNGKQILLFKIKKTVPLREYFINNHVCNS